MVIGKILLEILAVIIFLSIVSTVLMYYFGIGYGKRFGQKRNKAQDERER